MRSRVLGKLTNQVPLRRANRGSSYVKWRRITDNAELTVELAEGETELADAGQTPRAMTATDVIHQLQTFPVGSGRRDGLIEHDEEPPELLTAFDQGLRSLEEKVRAY